MKLDRKRKLRTAIAAILLMLLILLTGTYAWTQFNNVGFNAVYTETNFGGRFHDNFAWYDETGQGTHDKSLFAENFGENRIFVRVRLREFLRLGGAEAIGGADINNPNGWPIYMSAPGDVTERQGVSATIGNRGISWNMGHPTPTAGIVFMPTFNHATVLVTDENIQEDMEDDAPLFAHTDAFRMMEATGQAVDGLASGLGVAILDSEQVNHVRDIVEEGSQTGPGLLGHDDTDIDGGGQNVSNPEHGERDFWTVGDTMVSRRLYTTDADMPVLQVTTETHTHTARETLTPTPVEVNGATITNGVITMQQWIEADRVTGDFWVKDVDGWFYWARPLDPAELVVDEDEDVDDEWLGGATSLLLNQITIEDLTDEGVEYAIQVDVDFTNWTNVREGTLDLDNMTDNARDLWLGEEDIDDLDD